MKATATVFLLITVLATGAGLAAPHFLASKPPQRHPAADAPPEKTNRDKANRTDLYGDPLPAEAIARLGTTRFRHGYNVIDLAFTPDGTRLVSADWYGAHLWDAANGREIRRLGSRFQTSLRSLSLSPDGKTLALAEHHFGTIQIVDLANGELRRQFDNGPDNNDRFCAVRFSPNGKILASYAGKMIRLWDPATGKQLREWQADPDSVHRIVFTPDNKTLISGGDDRTIRFWDTSTGKEVRRIADHPGPIMGLALSPDGKTLASLGSTRHESNLPNGGLAIRWQTDNKVHLWDTRTGKKLRHLEAVGPARKQKGLGSHPNAIHEFHFAPDGKTLVTAGQDRFFRVWDVTEGKELRRWKLPWITSFAFSRDGKMLATGGIDCTLRLWDWTTGRELREQPGHHGGVRFLALSPDGRRVASASTDRTVRIWEATTGRESHRLGVPEGEMVPVAFSADGRMLTTAGVQMTIDGTDSKGRVWGVANGKELRQFPDWSECSAYAVANDGRTYAFAGKDKKVWFWDAVAERKLPVRIEQSTGILRMAFSPDARALFTWCGDRTVHGWDIATGKKIRQFELGDGGEMSTLAFSPDGRWFACAGRERTIRLYDLGTGEEVRRLTAESLFVNCLAFAPDGRTLAAGSLYDSVIYLCETASGQVRHRLTGHQGRIFALVFSADGKRLLSGSEDTTALLWDLIGDRVGERKKTSLSPAELKGRWGDLASADAETAYQALRNFTAAGSTVDFLRKQLQPIPVPDPKRIARLIADLDHDPFARREAAEKELEKRGEVIEPAVRAAHSQATSVEMRQRTERLLTKIRKVDRPTPSTSRLQVLRAIEVLERIGTAEARQLLRKLANGALGARQTRDAAAALARLARGSSASP